MIFPDGVLYWYIRCFLFFERRIGVRDPTNWYTRLRFAEQSRQWFIDRRTESIDFRNQPLPLIHSKKSPKPCYGAGFIAPLFASALDLPNKVTDEYIRFFLIHQVSWSLLRQTGMASNFMNCCYRRRIPLLTTFYHPNQNRLLALYLDL